MPVNRDGNSRGSIWMSEADIGGTCFRFLFASYGSPERTGCQPFFEENWHPGLHGIPDFKEKVRAVYWTPLTEIAILDTRVLRIRGVEPHAEGEGVYSNDCRQTWGLGEVLP